MVYLTALVLETTRGNQGNRIGKYGWTALLHPNLGSSLILK